MGGLFSGVPLLNRPFNQSCYRRDNSSIGSLNPAAHALYDNFSLRRVFVSLDLNVWYMPTERTRQKLE